jgi:hypothetical protein
MKNVYGKENELEKNERIIIVRINKIICHIFL